MGRNPSSLKKASVTSGGTGSKIIGYLPYFRRNPRFGLGIRQLPRDFLRPLLARVDQLRNPMRLLTIAELARFLHWSEGTVRNRLSKGAAMPPSILVGRHRLFWEDEVVAWVKFRGEGKAHRVPNSKSHSHRQTDPLPGQIESVAMSVI